MSDLIALATSKSNLVRVGFTAPRTPSGDHTVKETPVPIPNTAVKLSGPMIVPTSAKVGIARFYFRNPADRKIERGFCVGIFQLSSWPAITIEFCTKKLIGEH